MLCTVVCVAQTYKIVDVQGVIIGFNKQPVISASIYLLKAKDSSVVKFTTTNNLGVFKFNSVSGGNYLISVSSIGYQQAPLVPVVLGNTTAIDVGIINIKPLSKKINEVVVRGNTNSFIETKADKTVLNIKNSTFMIGSNALEVLAKSPGVQIDNSDNISLNGHSDALIMIDNKPTYLSGTALADMLRGMQSSMIDKIELISNPNASYDAAGTGGVINIRLVRDKNIGFNTQLTGGVGWAQFPDNRFSGYKGNTGINFNYRTKSLNVFGSYTYSNAPYYKSIESQHEDVYNNQINDVGVNLYIDQRRLSNNFRLGADYSIAPGQTLGFLVSGIITDLDGPRSNISTILSLNTIDSTIVTNAVLHRRQTNIAYNLNYHINFNKAGDMFINADKIRYDRAYNELFQSNYYYSYNSVPYRNLTLQNNSPSNFDMYVVNANYHLGINTNNDLSAGVKASDVKIDNTSNFGSVSNGIYNSYPMFTGNFKYSERINAAYVDYTHQFNKETNIELGLRSEQTISDGLTSNTGEDVKNNYIDFFPNVKLSKSINDNNQLQLGYGRRIFRPRYEELNPLVIYSDQYTYQIGNQYLKPYYSNLIELKHTYKDRYTTALSFEAVNGFTQVVYVQSTQNQVTKLTRKNLGNRYNYGLHVIAPVAITKWYSADVDVNALYQKFTGNDLNNGSTDVMVKIVQHFQLPFKLTADVGGYYETPVTFGIYTYKAQYYAWSGLTKSVLKKQGNIHLQFDGMFNSDKNVQTSHYQNLNLSATQINTYRTITLSFTYALGSKTIKAAPKKDTGAEDEQSRAGAGTN
jgi:iron complex outermembrane receptor protein